MKYRVVVEELWYTELEVPDEDSVLVQEAKLDNMIGEGKFLKGVLKKEMYFTRMKGNDQS